MSHDDNEGSGIDGTLAYLNALSALKKVQLAEARDYLYRAMMLGLSDSVAENAHLYLAEACFRTGQDEKAVRIIERILRTSPSRFTDPDTREILFPYTDLHWF